MASLASRCFAGTIRQRQDVADSGQSAMATTGQILLTAPGRHSVLYRRQTAAPGVVYGVKYAGIMRSLPVSEQQWENRNRQNSVYYLNIQNSV